MEQDKGIKKAICPKCANIVYYNYYLDSGLPVKKAQCLNYHCKNEWEVS